MQLYNAHHNKSSKIISLGFNSVQACAIYNNVFQRRNNQIPGSKPSNWTFQYSISYLGKSSELSIRDPLTTADEHPLDLLLNIIEPCH